MTDASPRRHDKFSAYRARKKASGLREVRLWTIDTRKTGFGEQLERACEVINASEDSRYVQIWMEEMTAEVWNELP